MPSAMSRKSTSRNSRHASRPRKKPRIVDVPFRYDAKRSAGG
jgi:hypothetical protein